MAITYSTMHDETNFISFTLSNSILDSDVIVLKAYFSKDLELSEEHIFLNALRTTADEFDDVLRELAD